MTEGGLLRPVRLNILEVSTLLLQLAVELFNQCLFDMIRLSFETFRRFGAFFPCGRLCG